MRFVVDWGGDGVGDFSDMSEEHESPERAVMAHMKWLLNECLDGDDDIAEVLKGECWPDYSMRVACESGEVWDFELIAVPTGFDFSRPKGHQVVWAPVMIEQKLAPLRCKFDWWDGDPKWGDEPGIYMNHFCREEPCKECAEMGKAVSL